ncbi:hypothetical protein GCM10022256_33000 [Frondihabitans peucedani]|uniref:Uncharacterized protein n=1 Tax=Frondihabitans peucedani TaxID=598626 RepID=A0ABP8E661_9MICO
MLPALVRVRGAVRLVTDEENVVVIASVPLSEPASLPRITLDPPDADADQRAKAAEADPVTSSAARAAAIPTRRARPATRCGRLANGRDRSAILRLIAAPASRSP